MQIATLKPLSISNKRPTIRCKPSLTRAASSKNLTLPSLTTHAKSERFMRRSNVLERHPAKLSLDQLQLGRVIGTGCFSKVKLAYIKRTREVTALKVMSKVGVVKMQQIEHVKDEKALLSRLKHPFIVNLLAAFQDPENLYLLQEFVPGGELYRVLRDRGCLTPMECRFYAAEVVSALTYLHRNSIVHRDLKPENLLLTREGHIKLADFGFAKSLRNEERTYTHCGTAQYLAPEVIKKTGHGYEYDWWELGVLIYEMMTGTTPFSDNDPMTLYRNILTKAIPFPSNFDPTTKDLIERLLEKDPTLRIKEADILKHEFFQGVNWSEVPQCHLAPSFVPKVQRADDASNFDEYVEKPKKQAAIAVGIDLFAGF